MNLCLFVTFLLLLLCGKIECINISYSECCFCGDTILLNGIDIKGIFTFDELKECVNKQSIVPSESYESSYRTEEMQALETPKHAGCFVLNMLGALY